VAQAHHVLHVHFLDCRPLFVSEAQLKATGTFRSDRRALLLLYGENFVLLSADALETAAAATAGSPAGAAAAAGEGTDRVPVLKLLNYAEVRVSCCCCCSLLMLLLGVRQTAAAKQHHTC
jgi:hypothetical protein